MNTQTIDLMMMELLTFITLTLLVRSKANKLKKSPDSGFVVYKMESEPVVEKYLNVLHIVDFNIFEHCLEKTEDNLRKFNQFDVSDIDLN